MYPLNQAAAIKTAIILCFLAVIEGGFILAYPHVWLSATFRNAGNVGLAAWILALAVIVGYVAYSLRGLPAVAALLARFTPFKLLAPVIALPSSIVEEVFFRATVMNVLERTIRTSRCRFLFPVFLSASRMRFGAYVEGSVQF